MGMDAESHIIHQRSYRDEFAFKKTVKKQNLFISGFKADGFARNVLSPENSIAIVS